MYELIIKNATLIDGTGSAPRVADVAVSGGKISRIGFLTNPAERIIDATGRVLCPGFIDSHSHSDYSLEEFPELRDCLQQGITFAIAGQCGDSVSPSREYPVYADFVESMQGRSFGVNMSVFAGHGKLRTMVAGRVNRPLTPEELDKMCRCLDESMEKGCPGVSLGLTYAPGSYADFSELLALARVVGRRCGVMTAHIRNENDQLIESVEEFIALCEEGKCRGVISHLKAADKVNHGKVKTVLAMIEAAASRGVEIYADAYPYCASATSLVSRFVPRQFHPPGTTSAVELLKDPQLRREIKDWANKKWGDDLNWVRVTLCAGFPEYVGKNMNDIAQMMGMEDRYEAVYTLLEQTKGVCKGCFTMMCEEDVATALAHPRVMVGSDSNMGVRGPQSHPRRVGTFPRVLGRYVREQKITTLPEMIRKITSLPAMVYGLKGKGIVAEGYDADLCVFDPETIRDTADYVNCYGSNQGMDYVIIDGKIVVEQGVHNGICAGKLYTR